MSGWKRGRACKWRSKWRKTPAPLTASVSPVAAGSSPKRLSDTRVLCPRLLPASPLMLEWSWKHESNPEGGKLARRGEARFIGQEGGVARWREERKEGVGGGGTTRVASSRGYSGHFAHEHICRDAPPHPPTHSQSNVNLISPGSKASNSPNYSSSFYGLQRGSDGEMKSRFRRP